MKSLKKPIVVFLSLALVLITLLTTSRYFRILFSIPVREYKYPSISHSSIFTEIRDSVPKEQFELRLKQLIHDLPKSRTYKSDNGKKTSNYFHELLSKYESQSPYVTLEKFHHSWEMSSLILTIQPPTAGKEIAVVGCHIDSINMEISHHDSPGVDDNLSGVVIVLQLIESLVQRPELISQFENALQFHFYSAEEYASMGSIDVFRQYQKDDKQVIGMFQLDMTGYTKKTVEEGMKPHVGLVVDYSSPTLSQFVKDLAEEYTTIPVMETKCGKICSDNAASLMFGFPSVYPLESLVEYANPYRHTVKDTIELIDFDHIWQFWLLALGYTIEMTLNDIQYDRVSKFTFSWMDFMILELMHEPKVFIYLSFSLAGTVGAAYYIYLEATELQDPTDSSTNEEELPLNELPNKKKNRKNNKKR